MTFRSGWLAGLAASVLLSGCTTLPSAPDVFNGFGERACPELATGPAPFAPPFPDACRTMNKTASGVRYIPLVNGDMAGGSPGPDATIVVNYEAFLADTGALIDSSYQRGESSVLKVADLIDGWGEAIQLMNPGDEWLVFVPSRLAFGDEPLGEMIPANADLVYRVKLDGFLSAANLAAAASGDQAATLAGPAPVPSEPAIAEPTGPDMAAWQAFFPWDPAKPGVQTLPSGTSIVVLEQSQSTMRAAVTSDDVVVHYEGRLAETSEFFDSSWSRGEPAVFKAGRLIPGFTEALTLMRPGDRVLVHIPADQAYGADGSPGAVPPYADLMFQINLLEIRPASAK